eukprot:11943707-Heterocapsa_arctica.AAC.1
MAAQAPPPPCPQCPIYVATITELEAQVEANEEDKDELRRYIAIEMVKNKELTAVIAQHEVHMDHRQWELNNARIDLEKQRVLHEAM